MKIAILTLPFHSNYGGILQAYALQTVLQRMGHEVVVIDKDMFHHRTWLRQQVARGAYLVRKYVLKRDVEYVDLRRADYEKRVVERNVRGFINKHLNILVVKDLTKEFPRDIDAVVVGSDQIWRHDYFTGSYGCGIENAFLAFLRDWPVKRVSYAASFGTGEWEYTEDETSICSRLIKLFDAVSVREDSAVALCKERLGRTDAVQMPDPTFLLTKEDYRHLFNNPSITERYLFYYVLDETEEIRSMAEKIAKERGLIIKRFSGDIDPTSLPLSQRIKAPIEEWLNGVAHAVFVFTDSFHACVFSILFEKPFKTIGNHSRGMDRFKSLLSVFGGEDVCSTLEAQRKSALSFLTQSLSGKQAQ